MWSDVIDLRDFYAGPLGLAARRVLRARAREMWPDVRGQSILGLGYATPFLGAFRAEAERTVALMPSGQGVLPWPAEGPPLSALTKENSLPLADLSVDRIILAHAVESAERLRPLMREAWRVLAEGGRMMVITPNRRGLWARFELSPFGYGLPYSSGQLSRLLRDSLFTPLRIEGALFTPPFSGRLALSGALAWERFGRRVCPAFGGVLIAEASKQVYAQAPAAPASGRVRRRVFAPVPGGLSQASRGRASPPGPVPGPVSGRISGRISGPAPGA